MNKRFEACLDALRAAGLTEATHRPGRFFRPVTDKTAFVLNITLEEDAYLHMVYGFTSTAFFPLGPGEEEFFRKEGCRSDDCTLRRCADAWGEDSLAQAETAIREFYAENHSLDKDTLLAKVKEDRKEFIAQVGALLKPHKFRKKGNSWTKQLENGFILAFHAQKSAFSDEYYFNISFAPAGKTLGCFQTRITAGGSDLFDWQLLDRASLLTTLEAGIREKLLPFLTIPLGELGRESRVWESCTCNRTLCPHCWVEKNLWEYKK